MFKLNFACRCTYFTSSSLQILLGCYELNFAYIRQTFFIYLNHTDYAILLCNKQGVSPSPAACRHRHASHFSTLQFTRTSRKHLALNLGFLMLIDFRTSQFTHALNLKILLLGHFGTRTLRHTSALNYNAEVSRHFRVYGHFGIKTLRHRSPTLWHRFRNVHRTFRHRC